MTDQGRLKMIWRNKTIVDLSRKFLDTNGAKQTTQVNVMSIQKEESYFNSQSKEYKDNENIENLWMSNLQKLNVCSQKGLVERFDSTIGAGSVLMPFGGKYQLSPAEGMAAKLPVLSGDTSTGTLMSFGYNPLISRWSPFHGAVYSVIEAVAKIAAMGGDYKRVRLTLQEYFEKLGKDATKWGKPFSALLGAYYAQSKLGIAAIGGKDSMSGTFKDLTVPPTLVTFAVDTINVNTVISTEFKKAGSEVVLLILNRDNKDLPDFEQLDKNYTTLNKLIQNKKISAAHSIRFGGIAEAISKMCFGNKIGFAFKEKMKAEDLFAPMYGSILLEIKHDENINELFKGLEYKLIGTTSDDKTIVVNGTKISLDTAIEKWMEPIEKIFPTKIEDIESVAMPVRNVTYTKQTSIKSSHIKIAKPRVFIPVFPGTNCEYDTARAFERAGAIADVVIVRNMTPADIEETIKSMKQKIQNSQIVMIPGGFSAGDEPDGSGKFIATAFRNPYIKEAVMNLLKNRDGLVLGICNGFQALIKLGLVPHGEIREMDENCPTLTFNSIGRHSSCMVNTRITSNLSPWFNNVKVGDIHTIAISHGEGRFVAKQEDIEMMIASGQIATQYVDTNGQASYDIRFNPNGSMFAVEGITSPDGRVLGKMGHSERMGTNVAKNVPGEKDQKLFEAGVAYFG